MPYTQNVEMEFDRDSFKSSFEDSGSERDNKSPFANGGGHNSKGK